MRKHLLLLALWPALPALAQVAPATPTGVSVTRRVVTSSTPPQQLADEHTAQLTRQLTLTPEQAEKVRAAELTRAQEHQAILRKYEALHWSGRIPPAEAEAADAKFEAQLAAICTPEQNQRRSVMRARFRQARARYDSLQQASRK